MTRWRIGLIGAAAAALLVGVPTAAARPAAGATVVKVVAGKPSEFRFTLSRSSVPAGLVRFEVANHGTIPHDFSIAGHRTRLLSPGQTQTLTVRLKAGKSHYLCTVPGHAAAGMKGVLAVGASAAAPVVARLVAATHAPRVGARWRYVVRLTRSGKPAAGTVTIDVVDAHGKAHPAMLGASRRKIVGLHVKSVFRSFVVWPKAARGVRLELRAVAHVGGTTTTAAFAVTPR